MGRTIRSTPNNDYAARAKVADNVTHLYQYKFAMMSMAGDFDIVF